MKIVNEKIIEKWRPILESANIKSNFEIFSEFCEKQIMKNTQTRTTLENISGDRILPINIKLLSLLELENKEVILSNTSKNFLLDFYIDGEDYSSSIDMIDRTILTTCQKFIKEKLEIYNTIILNDCIRSISFISEASLKPKVLIHLNVDFQ